MYVHTDIRVHVVRPHIHADPTQSNTNRGFVYKLERKSNFSFSAQRMYYAVEGDKGPLSHQFFKF
jgi:hypothetical protein